MSNVNHTDAQLGSLQTRALLVGVVSLVLCGIWALFDRTTALSGYLTAFLFWWGIAFGSLGLLMLNHLVGGGWGYATRPLLAAGATTMPLLAVLFVPIGLQLPVLYPWARPELVAADELLQGKAIYLNGGFFWGRAIAYFVVWTGLAWSFSRQAVFTKTQATPTHVNAAVSGLGLILLVFTVSFASIDWAMSLQPHWYSTIYGALFLAGGGVSAFALLISLVAGYHTVGPCDRDPAISTLHDLASLLLAFLLIWAYFAFSQYLIIWSANLPQEVVWFQDRLQGGWQWIALLIVLLHFVVPFLLLLSRERKRDARAMSRVACLVLIIHYLDVYWHVIPAFSPGTSAGLRVSLVDCIAPLGVGGIWLFVFLRSLRVRLAQ